MRLKTTLYILIFSLCMSSCGNAITLTPTKIYSNQIDWLERPICSPPCWANITPGKTTLEDALSILENIPEITITFESQDAISWQLPEAKSGAGSLSAENGVVSFIRIGNSLVDPVRLEKTIDIFGNPDFVKPYDCRDGMCSTILIYPNSGMLLDLFIENNGKLDAPQINILPETIVRGVLLFQPGMENFRKLIGFQDIDLLFDWHGFGQYP